LSSFLGRRERHVDVVHHHGILAVVVLGYRKPMAADGDILAALVHLGGPGAHGVDQIANTVRLIDRDGCDPTEDASGHVLLQTILDRGPAGGRPSWRRQHRVGAVQFGDRGGVFFVIRIRRGAPPPS
jgi:hypothetical protein